jgi:hypothetical protein
MDYKTLIDEMDALVLSELAKSFQEEGHKLTGALIEAIEKELTTTAEGLTRDYLLLKYGAYLNLGVKAEKIPFAPGSGAKKSLYIDGLIRYVMMRKRITDIKKAKSIAFAIAHTQKKEGMPIRTGGLGSDWIGKAVLQIEEKLVQSIGEEHTRSLEADIKDLTKEWSKKLTQ